MHFTALFGHTLRDAPADVSDPARRLMLRAALIRTFRGETGWLPLGALILARLEEGWRAALTELGSQEMRWPAQADLPGIASALGKSEIQSYRHLPARLYAFHESPPGFEWLSFQSDADGLQTGLGVLETRLEEGARSAGVDLGWTGFPSPAQRVGEASQPGPGGAWRWGYVLDDAGTGAFLRCSACGYIDQEQEAHRRSTLADLAEPRGLEAVETPGATTIQALSVYLGIPASATAKAVFYWTGERVLLAVIRGDLDINETKLRRALGNFSLVPATESQIRAIGSVPGYGSPIGVKGATVVVDRSVTETANLVAGANREGFHLRNTNVPRDYAPDHVIDMVQARESDPCPNCGKPLHLVHGRVIALSGALDVHVTYLDAAGRPANATIGAFTFDAGAYVESVIMANHDDKGICWPASLAPYDIHIVALNADKPPVADAVGRVCAILEANGFTYLLDDRGESAGVKFNDADLIGLPVRLTIGPRTVGQNAVEYKRRAEAQTEVVPIEKLAEHMKVSD